MPRRKKTRHGATQPEEARERKQLLLRLRPEVIDRLRQRAERAEQSVSDYVTSLVDR